MQVRSLTRMHRVLSLKMARIRGGLLRYQLTARQVALSVLTLCGLTTAAWLYWTLADGGTSLTPRDSESQAAANGWGSSGHRNRSRSLSRLPPAPAYKIEDDRWRQISAQLLSKPPPWMPVNAAVLSTNFPRLVRVARRFGGGHAARMDQLMWHRVPQISTADWQFHTPDGRRLSLASIQRALISGSRGYPVPNVAHYILPFHDPTLEFHHMVSILSCVHIMRPQLLILWYAPGRMVRGKWWAQLRNNQTRDAWESLVVMATRPLPEKIYSIPLFNVEHVSDVIRMEALLVFGGAYFDIDVIILKPLEPLRRYEFCIGRELWHGLCNGAFLSAPNSTFLAMWHTAYQVFNSSIWAEHSVQLPHHMHIEFPELCHVEEDSMDRPNWTREEVRLIYGVGEQKGWDWRTKNYVLHLWFRWYKTQHDMDSIKALNSMYGEVCRFILYGTTKTL